jgi:hypothetical protein
MTTQQFTEQSAESLYQPLNTNQKITSTKVQIVYEPTPVQEIGGVKVEVLFSNQVNIHPTVFRRPLYLMT